jgi:hypothetical protein
VKSATSPVKFSRSPVNFTEFPRFLVIVNIAQGSGAI